jgi:hypothetical protein
MNDEQKFAEHLKLYGTKAVSFATLMKLLESSFAALAKKLMPEIEALQKSVDELKANGPNIADAYKGAWMIGVYKRGSLVTHSGSLFLALKDTDAKPGTDTWKLVVKAGKDARA